MVSASYAWGWTSTFFRLPGGVESSLLASLVAQTVKNSSAMLETQVRALGRKDFLEKGMATHSSILA